MSVSGSTFTYFDYFTGLANSSGGNAVYWNLVDTVTAGTGNSGRSTAEELSHLADLKERGVISDAEFERLKAKTVG